MFISDFIDDHLQIISNIVWSYTGFVLYGSFLTSLTPSLNPKTSCFHLAFPPPSFVFVMSLNLSSIHFTIKSQAAFTSGLFFRQFFFPLLLPHSPPPTRGTFTSLTRRLWDVVSVTRSCVSSFPAAATTYFAPMYVY